METTLKGISLYTNMKAKKSAHLLGIYFHYIFSISGSLRRDVLRHDESVQAVRQENIMLAEKVQHATNLYRQLLSKSLFSPLTLALLGGVPPGQ